MYVVLWSRFHGTGRDWDSTHYKVELGRVRRGIIVAGAAARSPKRVGETRFVQGFKE
jgi:hypothetical protein